MKVYKEACSIAGFAIRRFDDEFEDERNRKVVPELKTLRDQLQGKSSVQKRHNEERLIEEAEMQFGFDKNQDQEPGFFDMIDDFAKKVDNVK